MGSAVVADEPAVALSFTHCIDWNRAAGTVAISCTERVTAALTFTGGCIDCDELSAACRRGLFTEAAALVVSEVRDSCFRRFFQGISFDKFESILFLRVEKYFVSCSVRRVDKFLRAETAPHSVRP